MGKKRDLKRCIAVFLTGCLLIGTLSGCSRERNEEQSEALVSLQKTVEYYEKTKELSHWEDLIALYGATQADGLEVNWDSMNMPDTIATDGTPGAYATAIIMNMAKGMPETEPVKQLALLQDPVSGSFSTESIEQHIWSMISLNVSQGSDNYNYAAAVNYLLAFQGKDGGFHHAADLSDESDLYLSGISAIALAPFYKENDDNSSVRKLLDFFKKGQLADGGYQSASGNDPSTISAVIWGLSALEQELPKSKEGKKTPLDALLSYQNKDGSFRSSKDGEETADPEATRRAAIALSDIVNGADAYVLLAQDAQEWRLEHTSGPSVTISIDYPYESKVKDIEAEPIRVTQNSTALNALLTFGKISDIPIVFDKTTENTTVTAINRVKNGEYGYDAHWIFKVNGQVSEANASALILQEGDVLEWIYYSSSIDSLTKPITPAGAAAAPTSEPAVENASDDN